MFSINSSDAIGEIPPIFKAISNLNPFLPSRSWHNDQLKGIQIALHVPDTILRIVKTPSLNERFPSSQISEKKFKIICQDITYGIKQINSIKIKRNSIV
jgi:hypothetical protein